MHIQKVTNYSSTLIIKYLNRKFLFPSLIVNRRIKAFTVEHNVTSIPFAPDTAVNTTIHYSHWNLMFH